MRLIGTAKKELHCYWGNHSIPVGGKVYQYRERASTSRESAEYGLYPRRYACETCATTELKRRAEAEAEHARAAESYDDIPHD